MTEEPTNEPTEERLIRARDIYINNTRNSHEYSYEKALIDAGICKAAASLPANQARVERRIRDATAGESLIFTRGLEPNKERFATLFRCLYEGMKESNGDAVRLAKVMRMAGFEEKEIYKAPRQIHKYYAQCVRIANHIKEELDEFYAMVPVETPAADPVETPAADLEVDIPETIVEEEVTEEVSPMSAPTLDSFACFSPASFLFGDIIETFTPEPLPPAQNLRNQNEEASIESRSTGSIISSITSDSGNSRKTPAQAQEARRLKEYLMDIYTCAYKMGTFLYSMKNLNPCKHLDTPNKCADHINRLFGVELISGDQLRRAVKTGHIGKPPPPIGRAPLIPRHEFTNLCDAFWSMCAIEQNNVSSQRLTREDEKALLGEIVNAKREKEGKDKINATSLMERINQRNSTKQDVTVVDPRKQIRTEWCTKRNQLLHYNNYFDAMCKRGYARRPKDEKERAEHGHLVFPDDQEKRQINMDEMHVSLDASKESVGGRPGTSHTTSKTTEGGKTDATPGNDCTIVMAVNDSELLPLGVIFETSAKDERGKINAKTLSSFKQLKGKWGYEKEVVADCYVAQSVNGSMNSTILQNYCQEVIQVHYPDCQDLPGKRVCLKLDSGPGRQNPLWMNQCRVEGIDIYPGLPNGSECNQEMDQLFGPFKSSLYRNRKKMIETKGKLSLIDVGHCLYGGTVTLEDKNGKVIQLELENAVELYYTPEKIRAAREKCGYCPATMNALNDPKMRGDIDDDDDGEDGVLRSMTDTLLEVERLNHEAVDELVKCGYSLATKLKRTVTRVKKKAFADGVVTLPNSRERQELYAKMRYPGEYFEITEGGGVYNTGDVLIGCELKNMKKQVKVAETRKKGLQAFYKVRKAATKLMLIDEKHYLTWNKTDLATAIKYKRGPLYKLKEGDWPVSTFPKKSKDELRDYYSSEYKGKKSAWNREDIWKKKDEEALEKYRNGEISCYTEGRIYGKALETQNAFIRKKIEVISTERKIQILSTVLGDLDDNTFTQLMNALPDDKRALIGLDPLPSSDDEDQGSVSSSLYHFSEEDQEFAFDFEDNITLVENEMTTEEMECAEMLREQYEAELNAAGNEDEDQLDVDEALIEEYHNLVNDEFSDDSTCVSHGSFKVDNDFEGEKESMFHKEDECEIAFDGQAPIASTFLRPPTKEGNNLVNDEFSHDSGSHKQVDDGIEQDDEESMVHKEDECEITVDKVPVDVTLCALIKDGHSAKDSTTGKEDENESAVVNKFFDTEEAPIDSILCSPTDEDGSNLGGMDKEKDRDTAAEESIQTEEDTTIQSRMTELAETIGKLQEAEKQATRVALYKLLVKSRGGNIGNTKKEETLKTQWDKLQGKPFVWSIDKVKSKLDELAKLDEQVHSC